MYKVVIIDDEPLIVQGLSKSIPWKNWDCQIAGVAHDGFEGMEVVRTEKPDIIFTDICMPKMDGLRMIAGLKSEFPEMQITILTGYREFEYVQEAIKLGVTRFLLKPSKMNELYEAIDCMTEKLKSLSPEASEVETKENGDEDKSNLSHNEANGFIVNKAMEYIREHYREKIYLVDVADYVFVSQWHLSKLLNKHTGSNFSELLNGIRVDKAKELLKDQSKRIYDIAEEVGFQDLAHFSRVFKKMEGISANEYRNKLK